MYQDTPCERCDHTLFVPSLYGRRDQDKWGIPFDFGHAHKEACHYKDIVVQSKIGVRLPSVLHINTPIHTPLLWTELDVID
jgi:hypothetical protein